MENLPPSTPRKRPSFAFFALLPIWSTFFIVACLWLSQGRWTEGAIVTSGIIALVCSLICAERVLHAKGCFLSALTFLGLLLLYAGIAFAGCVFAVTKVLQR
jgi:predicted neutral ceramidase superfamily lipid hydrolase